MQLLQRTLPMSIKLLMRVKNFVSVSKFASSWKGCSLLFQFQNLQNDTLANLPHGYINGLMGMLYMGK